MSNVLPKVLQMNALQLLCESNSIRGVCRLLKIDKMTVLRILGRYGSAAITFLDKRMRDLRLECLEVDEMWSWVGKKEGRLTEAEKRNPKIGDQYIYYAMDRHTKLIPCFKVGKRDEATTIAFIDDMASRLTGETQISTDGWKSYPEAIELAFGGAVRYGWTIKDTSKNGEPAVRVPLVGEFDPDSISTSRVERCNGTLRNFVRRCHRKTLCFSKKWDNLEYAIALHVMYYNFVKMHRTIGMPPAMKAKVVTRLWSFEDMFDALRENMV